MDGVLDADAQLVATNNGVSLWAGVKGDRLYVATNDAGEGNDHFVLLARGEQAPRPAMWAKAGQVAGWDAFLADENNNDYEGWFDAPASSLAATGPNGGVLEGVIDLSDEFGEIPTTVRIAVALYATPDGGQLLATHQVPASVNGNGNIDAAEYLVVDLCPLGLAGLEGGPCCIADFNGDGGVDDLDIAAFFAAFEAGEADVNGDEGVDDLDIAAFFTRFEQGC